MVWRLDIDMMARRVAFSLLSILIGYSIYGVYALGFRFRFGLPTEVYWLSFVFVSIPLLCEVVFWKSSPKLRLLYLLFFSLMMHLQYVVVDSSPLLLSEDAVAEYRLTDKIMADSQWTPFRSVELNLPEHGSEYIFYPITNFLYATTSLLTGIPLLVIVKYLFVVKALVVTPIVERWLRSFLSQRVAYFATVIFLASPGAILFPHKESFAMIFFFLGIYAITRIEKTRQYLMIGILSIIILTLTHHFTTYIFLAFLSSLFLASKFYQRHNATKVSSQFFLLCLVIFISWVAFIAWTVIATHQEFLFSLFFRVLLPGRATFSELLPLYTVPERIVVWLGIGITGVSTLFGFMRYVKNRKSFSSGLFIIPVFLMPLLVLAAVFRFSSYEYNVLISHRILEFGYIAVGAFSALFLIGVSKSTKKLSLNMILICTLIPMVIIGPMMGAMHPRTFSIVSNVVSFRALSLNIWMNESGANDKYTVGDHMVYFALSIYGDSKVVKYPELFAFQDFNLFLEERSKLSYVTTYVYMTDFYGPNATSFVGSPDFHSLYTNGLLNVYGISDNTSS